MADQPPPASSRATASVRSRAFGQIPATLQALNSTDSALRKQALAEAARSFEEGLVGRPQDTGWVNVLARTFFSYSVDASSPARLVWEAVIRGISVVGCADRDNLGALGEMLAAGDLLGVRTTVSLETKTFVAGYADRELNCPGQPGVLKVLGVGFTQVPTLDSEHGRLIASLPNRARERNRVMIDKANALLAPVSVTFEDDVLPLTPAGNATEEHLASAYAAKAGAIFSDTPDLAVFWSDVLGRSPPDVECLLGEPATFMEVLTDKLTRLAGGEPERPADDYPQVADFFQAVRAAGAVPCLYWRDGRSAGEADPDKLLDDAVRWGARAIALHPDRGWNIADPEEKRERQAAMAAIVHAARHHGLPVLAGSPMDGPRQKFVDSFDAPEMAPYFRDFTDSAFWLYGHTVMERAAGMGLTGEWARHAFHRDYTAANAFYLEVGKKAAAGKTARARIANAGPEATPAEIVEALTKG